MKVPAALLHSLQNTTAFDKEAFEKVHESGDQYTSIRLNEKKFPGASSNFFSSKGWDEIIATPVPWSSGGYYLSTRPSFTGDPLFHAGAYYVQEGSSMFLEEALKQLAGITAPLKILDLCAAPGGKSTLVQSVITDDSLLVSNEMIKNRIPVLTENLVKWGGANVVVTNNEPKDFQRLPAFFDVVIVDAPCSGSGLFRKDPAAIDEWSEQNVRMCSRRQQRILDDILPALKPGGLLIYSTCSFSPDEDEQIGDWVVNKYGLSSLPIQLNKEWGIIETISPETNAYGYRFFPDKLKGEGFFLAAFKKDDPGVDDLRAARPKVKWEECTTRESNLLTAWLDKPGGYLFIRQNEDALALPIHLKNELAALQGALYIRKAGVKMGAVMREELIPDHELALSSIISSAVPRIEIDKQIALQYLRRQEIKLEDIGKGWQLLTYQHLPLGWVKVLSNRVNNYYPKQWRIINK